MDQCIFCKIASGEIAAKKIYEDDHCVAVLDINPANKGHTLLIPKQHTTLFQELEEKTIAQLGINAKKISTAMLSGLGAPATNIFVANGPNAGQKAPHALIHIIPRYTGDGISLELPPGPLAEPEKTRQLFKQVCEKVLK